LLFGCKRFARLGVKVDCLVAWGGKDDTYFFVEEER
jgi:hypothetical protein